MSNPCTCPEPDFMSDDVPQARLGPHRHIVVDVSELHVGDQLLISTVIGPPLQAEHPERGSGWNVTVRYEGGLVATNFYIKGRQMGVTRRVES